MIAFAPAAAQVTFCCPVCLPVLHQLRSEPNRLSCPVCGFTAAEQQGYVDFLGPVHNNTTDEHYTLQWGREKAFFQFLKNQPSAKSVMPAGQLGWNALFAEIRDRAQHDVVSVYDAACGFGGIAGELVREETRDHLTYVGADIHHALPDILREIPLLPLCGVLLRWDISRPPPVAQEFDYIICRAAIHHTPNPRATFATLCAQLRPGGRLAISVYRKKSAAREAMDDCYRERIVPLPCDQAYELSRQFTMLGKCLQEVTQTVTITQDLPLFNVPRGTYSVQSLFYNHFLKCFYNPLFGEEYSTLVNYDWYHPPFAYRYEAEEIASWFREHGLKVLHTDAIEAQYFFLGEKPE